MATDEEKAVQMAILQSLGIDTQNLTLEGVAIQVENLKNEVAYLQKSLDLIMSPSQKKRMQLETLKSGLISLGLSKKHISLVVLVFKKGPIPFVIFEAGARVRNGKQLIHYINEKLKKTGYQLRTSNKNVFLTSYKPRN